MKIFIAFALITLSSLSFAGNAPIKQGDISISGAEATIVDVTPICPARPGHISCMAEGSFVTVSIKLGGCLDRLAGYHHSFRVKNGKGILTFAATKIFNRASMTARCIRMPTAEVRIGIPFEGQIEIENLEFISEK